VKILPGEHKIVLAANYLGNKSGSQRSAIDMLKIFLQAGYYVAVLSYSKKIPVDKNLLPLLDWIIIPNNIQFPRRMEKGFWRKALKWIYYKGRGLSEINYKKKIRRLSPSLLVINSIGGDEIYTKYLQELFHDVKSMFVIRGSLSQIKNPNYDSPYTSRDVVAAMKYHSSIVFVSSSTQKEWLEYGGISKKTLYIPNSIDEKKVSLLLKQDKRQLKKELKLSRTNLSIVCVANLQYIKGQDIIVDYFDKIISILPDTIVYLLGGLKDKWGRDLLDEIERKQLNQKIVYIGQTDNAMDYIYAADLFILPTRGEAMPRVILEAMALKTPVVASDIDGIKELIEHEVDGLLFSPDAGDEMVKQLEYAGSNYDQMKIKAESAFNKYWQLFSNDHMSNRYENAIMELLSEMN